MKVERLGSVNGGCLSGNHEGKLVGGSDCPNSNRLFFRSIFFSVLLCVLINLPAKAEQWGPLLSTEWHQGDSFNDYCPLVSTEGTGRCVVGCVATATTQIVNYWGYPQSIDFSEADTYLSKGNAGTFNVDNASDPDNRDFPTFSELDEALSSIAYDGNEDEEAYLCFGIGVKLESNYGTQTRVWDADLADMVNNKLLYGSALISNGKGWNSTRSEKVIQSIKNGFPVQMSVSVDGEESGHSVVIDGYNDESGEFHVNLGWGNSNGENTWYDLPTIDTTKYGFSRRYNTINQFVYDICSYSGWHQYGADEKNTFYAVYPAPTKDAMKDKWKETIDDSLEFKGLVVAAGNRIYATASPKVGSEGNPSYLYVYNHYGSDPIEIVAFPSTDDEGVTAPAATVDGKNIYVGSGKGNLYHIYVPTYEINLMGDFGDGRGFTRSPKIDSNGYIYLQTIEKHCCVKSTNEKWNFYHPKDGQYFKEPQGCTIDSTRDRVYIPYVDTSKNKQYLAVVSINTGLEYDDKQEWDLDNVSWYSGTASLLSNGDIVIGCNFTLYVLDKDDLSIKGSREWSNGTTFRHFVPAIGLDDTIYIPQYYSSSKAYFYALNSDTELTTKWRKAVVIDSDYSYLRQACVATNNIVVFTCLHKSSLEDDATFTPTLHKNG